MQIVFQGPSPDWAGGEVIRSQHSSPSGSNRSEVCVLVGSLQSTSPPGGAHV